MRGCRAPAAEVANEQPSEQVFEDILATIQSTFVFKGIRTAVLTRLVTRMRREVFEDGAVIVQQGDPAGPGDKMFYVQVPALCNACAPRAHVCVLPRKYVL